MKSKILKISLLLLLTILCGRVTFDNLWYKTVSLECESGVETQKGEFVKINHDILLKGMIKNDHFTSFLRKRKLIFKGTLKIEGATVVVEKLMMDPNVPTEHSFIGSSQYNEKLMYTISVSEDFKKIKIVNLIDGTVIVAPAKDMEEYRKNR